MDPEGSVTRWISLLKDGDRAAASPLWEEYFHRLVALSRDRLRGTPPRRRRGGRRPRRLRQLLPPRRAGEVPRPPGPRRPLAAAVRPDRAQGHRPGPPRGPPARPRRPGAGALGAGRAERRAAAQQGAHPRVRRPGGRRVPAPARPPRGRPARGGGLEDGGRDQRRDRRAAGRRRRRPWSASSGGSATSGSGRESHERREPDRGRELVALAGRTDRGGVRPLRGRLEGGPTAVDRGSPRRSARGAPRGGCSASCWCWSWPTVAGPASGRRRRSIAAGFPRTSRSSTPSSASRRPRLGPVRITPCSTPYSPSRTT